MGKHTRIVQVLKSSPSGLTIQEISTKTDLPANLIFCVIEGNNYGHEFEKFNENGQTKYQITQNEREP